MGSTILNEMNELASQIALMLPNAETEVANCQDGIEIQVTSSKVTFDIVRLKRDKGYLLEIDRHSEEEACSLAERLSPILSPYVLDGCDIQELAFLLTKNQVLPIVNQLNQVL